MAASLPAIWTVRADSLPGGGCQVSNCCEEWGTSLDAFHTFASKDFGVFSSASTVVNVGPTACPLLALTADVNESNGVCGPGSPDDLNVSSALQDHMHLSRPSVIQVVIEPGLCSQLSDSCWQAPHGSTTYVTMAQMTYHEHIKPWCETIRAETAPTVGWAIACAPEEPLGLRIRAEWVNGSAESDSNWCEWAEEDSFQLITESMWTPASIAGLPSWYCMDVPPTSMDVPSPYRALVYSAGQPPCMPSTTTTTEPPTDNAVRLSPVSYLLGFAMLTYIVL